MHAKYETAEQIISLIIIYTCTGHECSYECMHACMHACMYVFMYVQSCQYRSIGIGQYGIGNTFLLLVAVLPILFIPVSIFVSPILLKWKIFDTRYQYFCIATINYSQNTTAIIPWISGNIYMRLRYMQHFNAVRIPHLSLLCQAVCFIVYLQFQFLVTHYSHCSHSIIMAEVYFRLYVLG